MIAAETLRRIRLIELRTRKLVKDSLAGAYHSAFKGRGIEFDSVRPYEPGDDVRLIDWKVSARIGSTFVRQYVEERELSVILVVDTSASCLFGSGEHQKREVAIEIGSLLAYSAIYNNDKVGLLLFNTHNELYVPPQKGRNHILRLIHNLLTVQPTNKGTDIAAALRWIHRSLKRRSVIFVLSDFLSPIGSYADELSLLGHRHDVIALVLSDPVESEWPQLGLVSVTDAETGESIWIDTNALNWHQEHSAQSLRFRNHIDSVMLRSNVDYLHLSTGGDYIAPLMRLLEQRVRPRRG